MDFLDKIKGAYDGLITNKSEKKEVKSAAQKIAAQIKNQHSFYRKEIREWKAARIAALSSEMPRRDQYIQLCNDIMGDAFIYGKWENRRLRISNRDVQVETNGVVDDDKTKLLKTLWFNTYLKAQVDTKAFGYSLIYPSELSEDGYIKSIKQIPRTNVVPETCEILENTGDQNGHKYNEPPNSEWFLFLGSDDDLGLLDKLAPLWIFKKHSWQNWDEFEEMFGVPMRIAKIASNTPEVKKEVTKWLKSLGSAAYGVFPQGTDIEITESKSRDAFNVFNEKRKACNEEISILIDGQIESSSGIGSNAKAGVVLENTQKEITEDDATMALYSINEQLLPFLIQRGYPFTENDEVIWNDNKKSNPKDRLDIFKGVKDLGYKVKKEQVESELDVEIEEEAPQKPPNNTTNFTENFNLPHAHTGCGAHLETYRMINFNIQNELTSDEEELLRQIWKDKDTINWSYKEFMKSHGHLLNGVKYGYGQVDFDFESQDHIAMRALQNNIHRFGTDKTEKEILDLNKIIKDPTVTDYSKFRKRALKAFPNYNEHWLRTEYNQALGTSQGASRYNGYMTNIDIAPFWQYITVNDGKVRTEHFKLHKKVFRKDDPESWKFLPINGYGCRCDDIELIDYEGEITTYKGAIAADPDGYEEMVKSGHHVNWGDEKEVFTASQSYLSKLKDHQPLELAKFNYKTFDLKPFSEVLKHSLNDVEKFDFNKKTDRSGLARFTDFDKLPIWLSKKVADTIDKDILPFLTSAIASPDEVYFLDQDNLKKYFRHFSDGSIEVNVEFSKNKIAAITKVEKHKNPDNFRNGLLIHTPALKLENQRKIYEEFGADYTKEFFDKKTGGFVTIHKGHGKNELKDNKTIGQILAKNGDGIVLLDNPDKTVSADATINNVEWEFKTLENYSNLKNAIDIALRKGFTQSKNVLLYINNDYNLTDLYNGIKARVLRTSALKTGFVSVLLKDGRLITFSRKQVETGEFIKLFKK